MEYVEEGIAPSGELPAVYELETSLRVSSFGSHVGDVLGWASFGIW